MKETISSASSKLKDWLCVHVVFSKALGFIWVLIASSSFVEFAVTSVIVDYFTEVLNDDIREAVIISNVVESVLCTLVIVPHRSESYVGQFNVIIFYTGASVTGLMLLWVCEACAVSSREFFPLFSLAFLLIVLGKSGRNSTLLEFLKYQFMEKVGKQTREMIPPNDQDIAVEREMEEEDNNQQRNTIRLNIWFYSAGIVGACMTSFLPAYITWKDLFKVSALLTGSGYLVFYCGCFFYSFKKPEISLSKQSSENILLLRKLICRIYTQLLPKSSSNSSNLSGNPQMEQEVRKVRRVFSVSLLLLTLLPHSLMLPAATGFFVQQAKSMEFDFNVSALFVMRLGMRHVVTWLFWWRGLERQSITKVRIFCGMVCSMLCCLVAWRVELHRLSDLDVIMSGTRLIPQFLLLGLADGLVEDGFQVFFDNHVPESMCSFRDPATEVIFGIGNLLTVAFTLIFSRLGWFQKSLDDSRLDRYYLMLAILHFVFLFIYGCYSRNRVFSEPYPKDQESRTMELERVPENNMLMSPVSENNMLMCQQEEEHSNTGRLNRSRGIR